MKILQQELAFKHKHWYIGQKKVEFHTQKKAKAGVRVYSEGVISKYTAEIAHNGDFIGVLYNEQGQVLAEVRLVAAPVKGSYASIRFDGEEIIGVAW